jgi:hypothetical protein
MLITPSNTLGVRSFIVTNRVSHPYKTVHKITVFKAWTLYFWLANWETKKKVILQRMAGSIT